MDEGKVVGIAVAYSRGGSAGLNMGLYQVVRCWYYYRANQETPRPQYLGQCFLDVTNDREPTWKSSDILLVVGSIGKDAHNEKCLCYILEFLCKFGNQVDQ